MAINNWDVQGRSIINVDRVAGGKTTDNSYIYFHPNGSIRLNASLTDGAHQFTFDDSGVSFKTTLTMNNNKILSVATPTLDDDAPNKKYVDEKVKGLPELLEKLDINVSDLTIRNDDGTTNTYITLNDNDIRLGKGSSDALKITDSEITFYLPIDADNSNITNLKEPTLFNHAATKKYVDDNADKWDYNADNKNIINVKTPTSSYHAANKSYVDSKAPTSTGILGMQVFGGSSETTPFRKGIRITSSSSPSGNLNLDSSFVSWANNSTNKNKWIIEVSVNTTREENIDKYSTISLKVSSSGNLITSSGSTSSEFYYKSAVGGFTEIKTVGGTKYVTAKNSSANVSTGDYITLYGEDNFYSLSLKLIKIG